MPSQGVIETVRLTAAEVWWPWWPDLRGKLSHSLIPGRLRSAHQCCEAGLFRIGVHSAWR